MTPTNLFSGLATPMSEELLQTLASSRHVRIERIVSWGQATPPGDWYDQERPEWVALLQGEAGLRIEHADTQILKPGDCLLLPARCRHRVEWTSSTPPAVWLAVHFRED